MSHSKVLGDLILFGKIFGKAVSFENQTVFSHRDGHMSPTKRVGFLSCSFKFGMRGLDPEKLFLPSASLVSLKVEYYLNRPWVGKYFRPFLELYSAKWFLWIVLAVLLLCVAPTEQEAMSPACVLHCEALDANLVFHCYWSRSISRSASLFTLNWVLIMKWITMYCQL